MSLGEGETEAVSVADQSLDPFGFFPSFISRVSGLGGTEPGFDPFFVFHTPYVVAPSGRWRFTVSFRNLRAQSGTLVLRIHVLPSAPGAVARLVNSERLPLTRLTDDGASVTIDFVGMKNAAFALMGQVPDRTDAKADDLLVSLRGSDLEPEKHPIANEENTPFRTEAVATNAIIVSGAEPSLADPVSQPCTASQLAEPAFLTWSRTLGRDTAPDTNGWCDVFLLQALTRYGVLQTGARGLAAGGERDAAARALFDLGVDVEDVPLAEIDNVRSDRPTDFLYIMDRAGAIGRSRMAHTVVTALQKVRPGGMVLALFPYTHDNPVRREDASSALDRYDIERLTLAVIGQGHDLAQIRPSLADAARRKPNTMFGLITRRACVP